MLDRYADKLSSFSLHSTSTLWFEDLAGLSTAGANCGLGPSPRLGVKRQDDFFSDKPVLSNKCRFLERPRSPVRPCEDAPSRVATAVIDAAEQPNRISPDPFLSPTALFAQPSGGQRRAGMPLPQRMAAATAAAAAAKTLAKPVSKEALSKNACRCPHRFFFCRDAEASVGLF